MSEIFCECYPHRMGTQNKTQKWSQYFDNCMRTPALLNSDLLLRATRLVQPSRSLGFDTDVRCSGFPLHPVSPDKWNLCQDWDIVFLFFILCSECLNCFLLSCETSLSCAWRAPGQGEEAGPTTGAWRLHTKWVYLSGKGQHCPLQLPPPWQLSKRFKGIMGKIFPQLRSSSWLWINSSLKALIFFFFLSFNTLAEVENLVYIDLHFLRIILARKWLGHFCFIFLSS